MLLFCLHIPMRTKPEIGEAAFFPWGADGERPRKDKPPGRHNLQAHSSGSCAPSGEAVEPSECPRCWEALIGKIVSFSPDETNPSSRFCGAVVNVAAAPDYGLLPSCIATIQGRSGKTMQLDFTKHYMTIHNTWKEAEQ